MQQSLANADRQHITRVDVGWAESSRPTKTTLAPGPQGGPRRLGPPYRFGPPDGLGPPGRLVLALHKPADATFDAIAAKLTPGALVELQLAVGFYIMTSKFLETFGIDMQPVDDVV